MTKYIIIIIIKKIMYNKLLAEAHSKGEAAEEMLGKPLESDAVRMNNPL